MRAKEYLREYERQTYKVRLLEEELTEVNDSIDSLSQYSDGLPKSKTPKDKVSKLAEKLADLTAEIAGQRTEALLKKNEVRKTILKIKDTRYIQVLTERYILLNRWEQIAVNLNYSWRYAMKIHKLALEEVQKIIDEEKRT